MPIEDIWDVARKMVDNKGILTRIKHSARFHSTRSALSSGGSAGSKLLALGAAAGRGALALIPEPPFVASIVKEVEKKIEGAARKWSHSRSLRKAQRTSMEDVIKFEIKELSLENLDRYRWKLQDAMAELSKAGRAFSDNFETKKYEGAPCEAYFEFAQASQQAARRADILRQACDKIITVLSAAVAWADKCDLEIAKAQNEVQKHMTKNIMAWITFYNKQDVSMDSYLQAQHGGCENWCVFVEKDKPYSAGKWRENAATVTKFCASFFETDPVFETAGHEGAFIKKGG